MTLVERIEAARSPLWSEWGLADEVADFVGIGKRNKRARARLWSAFNGDTGAALSFARGRHPCWAWSVGQNVHTGMWLAYALALGDDRAPYQPTSATAYGSALALVAAVLRAKEGEG